MREIPRKNIRRQGYRKLAKKKRQKSLLRNRFFWLVVLFLVVVSGLIYFFIFGPVFQIEKIDVFGCQKIKREDVLAVIERQVNKKIILFQTKSIFLPILGKTKEIILENFPRVEKVIIKRNLPDGLAVEIKEREPRLVFVFGEDYFFVDGSGIVFEKVGWEVAKNFLQIKSELFSISNFGEKIIEDELLEQIFRIESELKNNLKIGLEGTVILGDRLVVRTLEGWEIYFSPAPAPPSAAGAGEDIDWQLTELKVVLEKEIPPEKRRNLEYIDLRFSRVYYKYR